MVPPSTCLVLILLHKMVVPNESSIPLITSCVPYYFKPVFHHLTGWKPFIMPPIFLIIILPKPLISTLHTLPCTVPHLPMIIFGFLVANVIPIYPPLLHINSLELAQPYVSS
jgi:hypothetical protein